MSHNDDLAPIVTCNPLYHNIVEACHHGFLVIDHNLMLKYFGDACPDKYSELFTLTNIVEIIALSGGNAIICLNTHGELLIIETGDTWDDLLDDLFFQQIVKYVDEINESNKTVIKMYFDTSYFITLFCDGTYEYITSHQNVQKFIPELLNKCDMKTIREFYVMSGYVPHKAHFVLLCHIDNKFEILEFYTNNNIQHTNVVKNAIFIINTDIIEMSIKYMASDFLEKQLQYSHNSKKFEKCNIKKQSLKRFICRKQTNNISTIDRVVWIGFNFIVFSENVLINCKSKDDYKQELQYIGSLHDKIQIPHNCVILM